MTLLTHFPTLIIRMAPSAIPSTPETTSELVCAGVKQTVAQTAPSLAINGSHSTLSELDASKLIVIRNLNPRPVPEPGSPEVWAQNVYEVARMPSHDEIEGSLT